MSLTATYDATLSRVQLTADSLGATATHAVVERSVNETLWDTVRGGAAVLVSSQQAEVHDYEFAADVANHYRITSYDVDEQQQQQFTTQITPALDGQVWLKNVRYPAVNQIILPVDYGDVTMRSRDSALPISGRSLPVGSFDLLGGRDHLLIVATETASQDAKLGMSLRVGGPWFIHVPTNPPTDREGNALLPGSMHVLIDTPRVRRLGGVSDVQHYALPLTEIAPPSPLIVGTTLTWQTVRRLYGSWTSLWSENVTWRELWHTIGDPSDPVVL